MRTTWFDTRQNEVFQFTPAGGAWWRTSATYQLVPSAGVSFHLMELHLSGKFGGVALIDDCDTPITQGHSWDTIKSGKRRYVRTTWRVNGKSKTFLLHRLIMDAPRGVKVDHRDGNTFNNCRDNLRLCSNGQNLRNRGKQSNNTTGFKGVIRLHDKFSARIEVNRRKTYLGVFTSAEDAARAYDAAAVVMHGDFARLNFPPANNKTRRTNENNEQKSHAVRLD